MGIHDVGVSLYIWASEAGSCLTWLVSAIDGGDAKVKAL